MAFREVSMFEVKEVLRRWLAGEKIKAISRQTGISRNTVKAYLNEATGLGLRPSPEARVTDEVFSQLMAFIKTPTERLHGQSWDSCIQHHDFIRRHLEEEVMLTKIGRLLERQNAGIPYATLHRYATKMLGFGQRKATLPVADCEPGSELQLDTGWMLPLEPDVFGRRRRFRAWIFTSVFSRHRFVYPCFEETTASAIEACEAAWAFFGGVFSVVIPDNTKAIVNTANPLMPIFNETFLEYSQSRGFTLDAARSKKPKDKARVERAVQTVREDCFRGEKLRSLDDCRARALVWCHEYGMRRHRVTQRLPLEAFEQDEKPKLKPAPTDSYDVPVFASPKVAVDQHASVAKALYSLPLKYRGKTLKARADRNTVRFYDNGQLVQTHERQPVGGRSTLAAHFPEEAFIYAQRDTAFLKRKASERGKNIGEFVQVLLSSPQPWTRMRQCFAVLSLAKKYGDARVEEACRIALGQKMHEYRRLERMVKQAATYSEPSQSTNVIPFSRFLRPAQQYAMPTVRRGNSENGEEK